MSVGADIDWLALARAQAPRFWRKVDKSGSCWLWLGHLDKDGYGAAKIEGPRVGGRQNQKYVRAHRLAWEMQFGPMPDGLVSLHSCDTPRCVNPAHVRPGTQLENRRDCVEKGRTARGEGHAMAKITEETARAIKARLTAGESAVAIARAIGVNPNTVTGIKYGTTWKHLEATR